MNTVSSIQQEVAAFTKRFLKHLLYSISFISHCGGYSLETLARAILCYLYIKAIIYSLLHNAMLNTLSGISICTIPLKSRGGGGVDVNLQLEKSQSHPTLIKIHKKHCPTTKVTHIPIQESCNYPVLQKCCPIKIPWTSQ